MGSGSYGKVYQVKNKITGEKRAMKQLTKTKIENMDKFADEINILTRVVQFVYIYLNRTILILLNFTFDYAKNTQAGRRISETSRFTQILADAR